MWTPLERRESTRRREFEPAGTERAAQSWTTTTPSRHAVPGHLQFKKGTKYRRSHGTVPIEQRPVNWLGTLLSNTRGTS